MINSDELKTHAENIKRPALLWRHNSLNKWQFWSLSEIDLAKKLLWYNSIREIASKLSRFFPLLLEKLQPERPVVSERFSSHLQNVQSPHLDLTPYSEIYSVPPDIYVTNDNNIHICDALHDLVPFVQFKKHKKHPWWSVNFSKVACCFALLKVTLLHECFSRFLKCTNGTKSHKSIIYVLEMYTECILELSFSHTGGTLEGTHITIS